MMKNSKTRTISGFEIRLETGSRYRASRPMASRGNVGRQRFTISITPLTGTAQGMIKEKPALEIPGLTYNQANDFLTQFNNGPTSFTGRVW